MAETRGRLLTGEIDELDERLAEEREAVATVADRRAALDERLARPSRIVWPKKNRSPMTLVNANAVPGGRCRRGTWATGGGCHRLI